ncbi:MAG: hypothetical protein ACE5GE_13390, partial [Phycisphaerae bacterium]
PLTADNSLAVVTGSNTDPTAAIDSLSVTAGLANQGAKKGAALFNANGSPTISNCTFVDSFAEDGGGAIYNAGILTITDSVFSTNRVDSFSFGQGRGAGILNDGTLIVLRCRFESNSITIGHGGAIASLFNSVLQVEDCTFVSNSVGGQNGNTGGAISAQSAQSVTVLRSTFDGNTATGGASGGQQGGAIANLSVLGSVTIEDCTFNLNTAPNGKGGAIYNQSVANVGIARCHFEKNSASGDPGGAVANASCQSVAMIDCQFIANSSTGDSSSGAKGGALYNSATGAVAINCVFIGNTTNRRGGGAVANEGGSDSTLVNCLFSSNSVTSTPGGTGGAVYNSNSSPQFVNCTFDRNSAVVDGGGIFSDNSTPDDTLTVRNCIFWGNADPGGTDESAQINIFAGAVNVSVQYSLVQGLSGFASEVGNIDGNPLFVRPPTPGAGGWGSADDDLGDLRVQALSPVIDAADNAAVTTDGFDIDTDGNTTEPLPLDVGGRPRFIDDPITDPDTGNGTPPIVDMGAHEFQSTDCNVNGIPDLCDIDCGPLGGSCDVPGCGLSIDCNANGTPDECEPDCDSNGIADTCDIRDCPAGTPSCGDCNANGVPDACDLAATFSLDCNTNGVPDECDVAVATSQWIGGTVCLDGFGQPLIGVECWNTGVNWCPVAGPNGTGFEVLVTGSAIVTLDISPSIDAATFGPIAAAEVNASSGATVRTLAVSRAGGFINNGIIRARDGRRLVLDAPDIDQTGGGRLEAITTGSILEINGATVIGGSAVTDDSGAAIHLIGGAELVGVSVRGVVVPDGQVGNFSATIVNEGVLKVAPSGTDTTLLAPNTLAGGTLSGNGGNDDCVRLGAQANALLGNFKSTFTNAANHAIDGAGIIFGGVINDGVIEANHAGGEHLILFSPGFKQNNNLMRATGTGVLRVEDAVSQSAAGLVEAVAGGTVVVNGSVTGQGGFRSTLPCTVPVAGRRGCTPPLLQVSDGASLAGATLQADGTGIVEVQGSAAITLTGAVTIQGGTYQGLAPTSASLTAGAVSITGDLPGIGQMLLDSSMTVRSGGAFSLLPCFGRLLGCTPPLLHVRSNAGLDVDGDLSILTNANLLVDSTVAVTLAGNFINQSTDPLTFDWAAGQLTLDGTTQSLEAAGQDRGADVSGLVDNFALLTLELAANTTVNVIDVFDNQQDLTTACDEALYVDTLILNSGATLNTGGCTVFYLNLQDNGGIITAQGTDVLNVPTGDFDGNGQVDLDDYTFFHACLIVAQPAQICLDRFDADHDFNLDLRDYAH